MTPAEFKASLLALWGPAWRDKAPEAFDVNLATLDRWANGHVRQARRDQGSIEPQVPGPAGRLMEHLLAAETARKTQRRYEHNYQKRVRAARREGRSNG